MTQTISEKSNTNKKLVLLNKKAIIESQKIKFQKTSQVSILSLN